MTKRSDHEKSPKKRSRVPGAVIGVLLVIILLAGILGSLSFFYSNRTFPNATLAGIPVGNLTSGELETKIGQLIPQPIIINAGQSKKIEIKPQDIDLRYDAKATAKNLLSLNNLDRLIAFDFLKDQKFVFSYDEKKLNTLIADFAAKVDIKVQDATLELKKDKLSVKGPSKPGFLLNQEKLKNSLAQNWQAYKFTEIAAPIEEVAPLVTEPILTLALPELETRLRSGFILTFTDQKIVVDKSQYLNFLSYHLNEKKGTVDFSANPEKVSAYVKTIAKQINRDVKDAQLKMSGGKVQIFQSSQDGLELNKDKAIELISVAIKEGTTKIELPINIVAPRITTNSVNDLGIKELIGTATTNFRNSPENRKHNITTGATALNGILVPPNEVFSTISTLGNPDADSGYLPELVIKDDKTTPEFGGGLCQVSTTLFRSAMNSGLPIVERQNHSWRISYYEPPTGLDATVYYPKPDFKFKNDTPGWILIQSKIEGTTITFDMFGTKDGRRSEVSSQLLYSTPAPDPVYTNTDTLQQGETKQIEKPHPGGKAIGYYKVFDKDGKLINDQTFVSLYKSVSAKFLVGTATPPPSADQPVQ